MMEDEVEEWIEEREPVEQDNVVDEFGNRGLEALHELMLKNRVSYTIDWKVQTE